MKKKLLAPALASLIAAPAFAQSEVSIFGTVDMGYRWSGNNIDSTVSSRSRIDSGTSVPSRIGFRGSESLGNGLTASFILEAAINTAGGELLGGGGFSRQAL
jgi:predicted porin